MTSRRTDKLAQMAVAYRHARQTADAIRSLLIDALEPKQAEALAHVAECGTLTAPELGRLMGVELNQSSTLLKQLHDAGLLARFETSGRRYRYEVQR